ncbi:hypothetical protein CALVIDRAFT_437033 [Calocera viscosa TUFC12733]|uniref:Uncharacterized protein n=1 Tax=Calocera viscosa (strain TUFC12733) TaxID=1330018 RepID=A0A167FTY2_CALVF|nr:hypothetical protein CALVIDRAFT_437033 [Calocera viscosa TUFC12733]
MGWRVGSTSSSLCRGHLAHLNNLDGQCVPALFPLRCSIYSGTTRASTFSTPQLLHRCMSSTRRCFRESRFKCARRGGPVTPASPLLSLPATCGTGRESTSTSTGIRLCSCSLYIPSGIFKSYVLVLSPALTHYSLALPTLALVVRRRSTHGTGDASENQFSSQAHPLTPLCSTSPDKCTMLLYHFGRQGSFSTCSNWTDAEPVLC